MADNLKAAPDCVIHDPLPDRGETLAPYEYAVDQQVLAFRLSLLTRDFTFFHVLRAHDISSGANPGAALITLCPDGGEAINTKLLSYSLKTVKTIEASFHEYVNHLKRP